MFEADLFSSSRPFPTEESVEDEDIYNHLEDLIEYDSSASQTFSQIPNTGETSG